jgi:hypothetical protein
MKRLEKSIDTGGMQQVLSGEDQSEVPVFKSFKHVSTKPAADYNKIMRLDKKYRIRSRFGLMESAGRSFIAVFASDLDCL